MCKLMSTGLPQYTLPQGGPSAGGSLAVGPRKGFFGPLASLARLTTLLPLLAVAASLAVFAFLPAALLGFLLLLPAVLPLLAVVSGTLAAPGHEATQLHRKHLTLAASS
jgi:hypothetical protein